jgi:hypothetical protein
MIDPLVISNLRAFVLRNTDAKVPSLSQDTDKKGLDRRESILDDII